MFLVINKEDMKAFVERLFEEMELSLKEVVKETSNEIQKAEKCCQEINAILIRLKDGRRMMLLCPTRRGAIRRSSKRSI